MVEFVFLFPFHKATHDTICHKAAGCLIASQLGIVFWGIAMTAIVCQHFGNQTHFKLRIAKQVQLHVGLSLQSTTQQKRFPNVDRNSNRLLDGNYAAYRNLAMSLCPVCFWIKLCGGKIED